MKELLRESLRVVLRVVALAALLVALLVEPKVVWMAEKTEFPTVGLKDLMLAVGMVVLKGEL